MENKKSINNFSQIYAVRVVNLIGFPARSVMLLECNITVYLLCPDFMIFIVWVKLDNP
jgi:hypothetical protein